ncbi:MAG: hypothetical protein AB1916_06925 [Thermodesulfobacteriota bacterium]
MDAAKHMGRVSATAMHDMLNVLAGIKETVGLMEDLLCRCKLDPATLQARFKTMAPAMLQQVGKGVILAESLNRLGHLVADPEGPADAATLARLLVDLTSRRARMRRISAHVEETGACPAADPLALLCGLGAVLEACYAALPPQTELRLALARDGGHGVFRLRLKPAEARASLAGLDAACPGLDPAVTVQQDSGAGEWRLRFPCAQAK